MNRKEYYENHKYCPFCSKEDHEVTTIGCVPFGDNYDNFKDDNVVYCSCGFKGIIHDLQPKFKWYCDQSNPSGGIYRKLI